MSRSRLAEKMDTKQKEKLIDMLALNQWGKGCNNDELIEFIENISKS